jgi:hypothetical protein
MSRPSAAEVDRSGAALVCEHVAQRSEPIRVAFRVEPVDDVDSGWQFFCGSTANEDHRKSAVWSLNDVLDEAPGLCGFLTLPPGSELVLEGDQWTRRG